MSWPKTFSLVLALALCAPLAKAFNREGNANPFDFGDLESIAICDEALRGGLPFPVPVNLLRNISGFPIQLNTQTGDNPYIPMLSRFAAPPFLDAITSDPVVQAQLLNFLGNDLNEMLQRISDPRPAPAPDNPCNLTLRQTQEDTNQENAFMIEELFARRIAETPNIQTTSDPLDSIRRIMQGLNCYLNSGWVELPVSFFPRYFAGTNCIRRNCALPDGAGMYCTPDFSSQEIASITVLRWDCCWAVQNVGGQRFAGGRRVFTCGWRKVTFPLVCDCDCRCDD